MVLVGCLAALASGCSDGGGKSGECSDRDCSLDGSTGSVRGFDAALRDGSTRVSPPFQYDGGMGEELEARIQVNGGHIACGACAVLVVQAQGGQPPYTYQWSDPKLAGPGPHQVCPDAPTGYSVTVTDSSEQGAGEFSMPAQSVSADGRIDCDPDAGVDSLGGCFVPEATDAGADSDAGVAVICGDAGITQGLLGISGMATASLKLSDAFSNVSSFKAGRTYTFNTDRLLPFNISLGKPVTIELFGGTQLCEPLEKLVSVTFDIFSWHQASCFTPSQDYAYLIETISLDGQLIYWDFLDTVTICDGCQQ